MKKIISNKKTADRTAKKTVLRPPARGRTALPDALRRPALAIVAGTATVDTAPAAASRRPRRTSSVVTLRELAEIVGVTKVTVSRALNTPHLVSADTLERVRAAVSQTGYIPNLNAGALASSKSRLIVALIPSLAGAVFQDSTEAMTVTCARAGYQLLIGQSAYDESREDALIEMAVARRPAGIVLTGVRHSAAARRQLSNAGIPVLEMWDLTRNPIDMLVGFSHKKIGQEAARFLLKRGARHPALITPADARANERANAFIDTIGTTLKGVTVPVQSHPSPTSMGDGRRALAALLDKFPNTDAVFCGTDVMALGALTEAQSRGIAVPGKLKIMGYGDLNFAGDTNPALTSIRIDGAHIGQLAASMLIDRIEEREVGKRIVDVGFTLVERDST